MAKVKEEAAVTQEAKILALEAENKILQEKLVSQEALNQAVKNLSVDLTSEISKIRAKGQSTANTITVGHTKDYNNVTLWTKWGKPVGPMHPDNAIQALHRFAAVGIQLSVKKPTPEEANAWSASPEGKAHWLNESKKRAKKDKTRKAGQMEKLTAIIAQQTGIAAETLNQIKQQHEVRMK